jgi:hypothetical protein
LPELAKAIHEPLRFVGVFSDRQGTIALVFEALRVRQAFFRATVRGRENSRF